MSKTISWGWCVSNFVIFPHYQIGDFYKQKFLHILGCDCGHNIKDLTLEQLCSYYKDLVAIKYAEGACSERSNKTCSQMQRRWQICYVTMHDTVSQRVMCCHNVWHVFTPKHVDKQKVYKIVTVMHNPQ